MAPYSDKYIGQQLHIKWVVCWPTALSHCLNQCWLEIIGVHVPSAHYNITLTTKLKMSTWRQEWFVFNKSTPTFIVDEFSIFVVWSSFRSKHADSHVRMFFCFFFIFHERAPYITRIYFAIVPSRTFCIPCIDNRMGRSDMYGPKQIRTAV